MEPDPGDMGLFLVPGTRIQVQVKKKKKTEIKWPF